MKEIYGDLIELAKEGKFNVIAHGCNCFCTMGHGIAATIKMSFPEVWYADQKTKKGDRNKLGTILPVKIHENLTVVNIYTQFEFGGFGRPIHADYNAIKHGLKELKRQFSGKSIGLPLIGAGLAGGDWILIKAIIEKELENEDVTIVYWKKN